MRKSKPLITKSSKTAKISDLSSRNVHKYEFLRGEDVLPELRLLKKVATIKRFEYLPVVFTIWIGSDSKKQTDVVGKQYRGLEKVYNFDKKKGGDETISKE